MVYNTSQEFLTDATLEIDFVIGAGGCTSNCYNPTNPADLSTFVWGSYVAGGFGGITVAEQPADLGDWKSYGTVLKDMVSLGQDSVAGQGGVAYDGYTFGSIGFIYCGWSGPFFNHCSNRQDHSGYHIEQYVPNSYVVQTSPAQYYDEYVYIQAKQ